MKIKINGLKEGKTNINIKGSVDGGDELVKSFHVIVNPNIKTYNSGVTSYDELIERSFLPLSRFDNVTYEESFVPCSFSEDGTLTITGLENDRGSVNGVYTPEPGKWKNPNLEPIRYTGDNGITFILRYVKNEVFQRMRATIYGWNIQFINKLIWGKLNYSDHTVAGFHLNILTEASLRWCLNFTETTPNSKKPLIPSNYEVYYTQEIKDAQGDDFFLIPISLIDFTKTFTPYKDYNDLIDLNGFKPTEDQKAWNVISVGYSVDNHAKIDNAIKIPNMSLIPKGDHLLKIVDSNLTVYEVLLHKEI